MNSFLQLIKRIDSRTQFSHLWLPAVAGVIALLLCSFLIVGAISPPDTGRLHNLDAVVLVGAVLYACIYIGWFMLPSVPDRTNPLE